MTKRLSLNISDLSLNIRENLSSHVIIVQYLQECLPKPEIAFGIRAFTHDRLSKLVIIDYL